MLALRAVVYVWLPHDDAATAQQAWQTAADFMGSVQPEWGSDYPLSRGTDALLAQALALGDA